MTSGINSLRRRVLFQRVVALSSLLEAEKNARTGSSYLREQIYVVANSLPLLGVPL